MIPAALKAKLTQICGPEGVIAERDRLLVYESDALTAYRHRPSAVVLPRTTEEVSLAVQAIAEHDLAIVPRGAGTGLSGGAVALDGAMVLGTARMNRILNVDAKNRSALLQPGVINLELSAASAPHGLYYAPDPSSQTACTIGGNVAENSGGPHCLKYGVTSRYITGLTVVLPDGEVTKLGGSQGEASGYDLVGLFVGSEGCFGIATEIEVSLLPVPEGVRTLLAIFDRLENAGQAVSDIVGSGLLPAAMEIIDGVTIRAVEDSVFAAGYPTDAEAALVIEFDGLEAGLDREVARSRDCCEQAGAREVRSAQSEAERLKLWKGRKKAFGAMGRIAPDLLVQDATVPRTTLPEILKGIADLGKRYNLVVANVFHAGDGNLHPNIIFDRRNPDELERVEQASKEIMQLCVNAGGTITGEHGVGLDKKHHMPLIYGPDELAAMWGVRRIFDPAARMNPGKVLPDESRPDRLTGAASPVRTKKLTKSVDGLLQSLPDDQTLTGEAAQKWSRGYGARAVAFPTNVDEVAHLACLAAEKGVRLTPAGVGSWLTAGGWGNPADLVVSTERMSTIHHYEPADLTLTASAGLTLEALAKTLGQHGQWLPLDSPGSNSGTLGAAVACGIPGPLSRCYGLIKDNVLGVEVVTGEGRVLRLGGRVVKNVAGYDLVRLMTGSRGSLGIITSVSVRLFPKPKSDFTLLFTCDDIQTAARLANSICISPLPVASVEVMSCPEKPDGLLSRPAAWGRRAGAEGPKVLSDPPKSGERQPQVHTLSVVVRLLGGNKETAELHKRIRSLAGTSPQKTLRDQDSERFHQDKIAWEEGAPFVARLARLPSELESTLNDAWTLARELGGELTAHACQGVVRVKSRHLPDDLAGLKEHLAQLRQEIKAAGGTLTLSQAPASVGAEVGWTDATGNERHLGDGLKALFDPVSILSPAQP